MLPRGPFVSSRSHFFLSLPRPMADQTLDVPITRVGVLGGGLMGSGIAQVAANAGFTTIVREVSEALCQRARGGIEKTLAKGIERGKVTTEERDKTLGQLSFTTEVSELKSCD